MSNDLFYVLRRALYINDVVASTCGSLINIFLLYILYHIDPSELKNYKKVILLVSISDLFLSPSNSLSMMSFEPFMGQILLFTEGVTVYFNNISWIAVWTCYHVFTFCLSFCNVTLTFIYRYFILIHNYVLGRTQFILLTVFVIFWNLMFVLFLGLSLVNEKSPNYNIILQRAKEVYKEEIEHGSSQLVILDIFGTFGVLFNAFLTLTIVLASIIIIYCFAKIRITLNSQQNIMSKRSKELQRQLNKAMLIHASVPMIICFLPISILELMGYLNINIKAFCTLFFFAFEWVPFFNGIISLTLIGSCRNYTKKIFGLEVKVEKITQATVID